MSFLVVHRTVMFFITDFLSTNAMHALESICSRYYSERFIANVTPCFLRAVQFSFGLLCMVLFLPKTEC